jgi:hypothetical protein
MPLQNNSTVQQFKSTFQHICRLHDRVTVQKTISMGVVDGYVAAFTPLRHDQNGADSLTVLALSLVAWNEQGVLCESGIVPPSPWIAMHEWSSSEPGQRVTQR